jgi:hypothetical protein
VRGSARVNASARRADEYALAHRSAISCTCFARACGFGQQECEIGPSKRSARPSDELGGELGASREACPTDVLAVRQAAIVRA